MSEIEKTCELTDKALDGVAGGDWGGKRIVTCDQCRIGKIAVDPTGTFAVNCPHCGAALYGKNGVLSVSAAPPKPSVVDKDPDDFWLE